MKIGNFTILDGNGDPIVDGVRYFNRYQSTLPHKLVLLCFRLKKFYTVGGFVHEKPVVDFMMQYGNGNSFRSFFESQFIAEGIYAFDQLIPVNEGIKLNFEYCNNKSMIAAYKKKLGIDDSAKNETAEAKPYRVTVHCDNKGIKVEGARTDIGSTCDTDASDLDGFLRIAEHWWNTYCKPIEKKGE